MSTFIYRHKETQECAYARTKKSILKFFYIIFTHLNTYMHKFSPRGDNKSTILYAILPCICLYKKHYARDISNTAGGARLIFYQLCKALFPSTNKRQHIPIVYK